MAYSKQTWTDDVSAVTGARMTHIEQGIYDNSLGIDKINPSGTATTTAEIEEGQISDVIGFKSLKLKGKTSQYTTTGSQLFDLSNTNVDTQYNYNNGFKLTKSTNRTREITLRTPIPSGNYYISADVINSTLSNNNQMYVTFKGANNTNVLENVRFLNNGAVTINAEVVSLYFFVANSEADTATITLDNIMLNSGSTRKNFEKYTGGKASPNPDYPQDVNNVSGDNVVGISNKNLIEYSFKGYNITSQGKFETGGTSLDFDVHIAKVKAGTTYTITPATNVIAYFDERPTITSQAYNNSKEVITNTNRLTPTRSSYIAIRTATSNTAQLEKGTSATSFVAHQGNNFEINLGTIEICKIGTYQDYIFKRDGKWWKHKEIGKYTITGSSDEAWVLNSSGTYYKYQWSGALPDKYNVINTPLYCDHFTQITVAQGNDGNVIGIANGYYSGYSLQIVCDISTLADFKTWLAENTPVVYYPLATATDTEITYTPLIRQLDELYNSGLYDVTNISQDNSSEAFVLDMEACKNNINGIVEYIRR